MTEFLAEHDQGRQAEVKADRRRGHVPRPLPDRAPRRCRPRRARALKALGFELIEMEIHGGPATAAAAVAASSPTGAPSRCGSGRSRSSCSEVETTGAKPFVTACSQCRFTLTQGANMRIGTRSQEPARARRQQSRGLKRNLRHEQPAVVVDPVTRIEGHLRIEAQTGGAVPSPRPTPPARWCAASRSSCAAAIRARPGHSRSASAACARWCTASPRCARWRTR